MAVPHTFQDETLTEWLNAMPQTLRWTLGVSPVRIARGLQDGSWKELWARERVAQPSVDEGRLEMWADGLVDQALIRLEDDPSYFGVHDPASTRGSLADPFRSPRSTSQALSAEQLVRISLAMRDGGRGRVLLGHCLVASDQLEEARAQALVQAKASLGARIAKCHLQLAAVAAHELASFEQATSHYLDSDQLCVAASLSASERFTSLAYLLLLGLERGFVRIAEHAIDGLNSCGELPGSYQLKHIKETAVVGDSLVISSRLSYRDLEARMSPATRALLNEVT